MNENENMIYLDFDYRCDFCDAQAGSNPISLDGESMKLCGTCFGFVTEGKHLGFVIEGWAKK